MINILRCTVNNKSKLSFVVHAFASSASPISCGLRSSILFVVSALNRNRRCFQQLFIKSWSVEIEGKDKLGKKLMRWAPSGVEVIIVESMFVELSRVGAHCADGPPHPPPPSRPTLDTFFTTIRKMEKIWLATL